MKKLLSILLLCFCFSATAQNSSTIQQLLDEGVTVGELLDAGVTPEEFYGKEFAGGYIFDIDTAQNKGKVVANHNSLSFKFASSYGSEADWNTFESDASNGLSNTQNMAQAYSNSIAQIVLESNHSGFNDWYIPTIDEAYKIAESYKSGKFLNDLDEQKLYTYDNRIFTSEYHNFQYGSHNVHSIQNIDLSSGTLSYATTSINNLQKIIMVREFDLDQPQVSSFSPALESFLETYTPPVVEDEVVSDANSFDVLNPLSYNGEFEAVHYNFSDGSYTVPQGKSLVIQALFTSDGIYPNFYINNVLVSKLAAYSNTQEFSTPKLILSSGDEISIEQNGEWVNLHGVLINKTFNTIHHNFSNGNYIVPHDKSLIVQAINTSDGVYPDFHINNVRVSKLASYANSQLNSITDLLLSSDDEISIEQNGEWVNLHGILIDNSNYTYATDYELIEALNEGMDSLSTMSEMVVLENDSISSQNTILSQENEALMAIDYNFDSLQYVADFLSSQVFELQQELLVPNIDVDMAIGWNMVGFSCPQQKTAEDALLSIVDEIIIFKDNSGNVYMPEFSFNGIGDLTPGHGYQLKVTDYILDFNICE